MNNSPSDFDRPQTVKRGAKLIEISESGLRKMIAAGIVPAIRIGVAGGGVRVIPRELIESLKRRPRRKPISAA